MKRIKTFDELADCFAKYVVEDLGFENNRGSEILRDIIKKMFKDHIGNNIFEKEINISYEDKFLSAFSRYIDDLNAVYIINIQEKTITRKKMF